LASKKTLNAKNLEDLGATRLAQLLIEISTGNALAKRRLRLELAGAQSPGEVAREVDKRLSTIRRSRSFVDWQNRKALIADLQTQRKAIVEQVAQSDPAEGMALMWRFLGLANSIFGRCDDSSGMVIAIFHEAVADLAEIAVRANPRPEVLGDAVYDALTANEYGQYDDLIGTLAPVLGERGLTDLRGRMTALAKTPVKRPAGKDRVTVGWASSGAIYQDEIDERGRDSTVKLALMEIADALGDVDAFIAQYDEPTRKVPRIAAEIANRLVAADRADDALQILDAATQNNPSHSSFNWPDFKWVDARIAVLDALGRGREAQDMRWSCFESSLSSGHLREYLKQLADFEDIDAETRAFDHAQACNSVLGALSFFVEWPKLDRAAGLVIGRFEKIDGDHYEILTPTADALSAKYPLAASLVLRAMIDFTLIHARSKRYKHAARHLIECASLSRQISDFGAHESHTDYEARLRKMHGRKGGFWGLVD
jgi:hypothetical protein